MSEKGKITRGRLGSLSLRKEGERQCFLFSKHLIICTRGSGGKLHLTKVRGRGLGPLLLPAQRVAQLWPSCGPGWPGSWPQRGPGTTLACPGTAPEELGWEPAATWIYFTWSLSELSHGGDEKLHDLDKRIYPDLQQKG